MRQSGSPGTGTGRRARFIFGRKGRAAAAGVAVLAAVAGTAWAEFTGDLRIQVSLAGAGALAGVVLGMAMRAHLWAVALAIPGLVLERRLISARFAALYDRSRMGGLYEVTLEANRALRQEAVLETILDAVRRLLRSPEAARRGRGLAGAG